MGVYRLGEKGGSELQVKDTETNPVKQKARLELVFSLHMKKAPQNHKHL